MDKIEFYAGTHQVFKEYLVDNEGQPIKPTIVQNVELVFTKYGEYESIKKIELKKDGDYIILEDNFVEFILKKSDTIDLCGLYIVKLRITDRSNKVFESDVHKVIIKRNFN